MSYCAYTPCFRSEAGSYGKDVRGLIRQHQFNKVELVQLADRRRPPRRARALTAHAEEVLKRLGLPYRVIVAVHRRHGLLGGEDLRPRGLAAGAEAPTARSPPARTARRLPGAARQHPLPAGAEREAAQFVHTLNGSGLAVGRTSIAILENYQQADGSVIIPEALRPYLGGLERITKRDETPRRQGAILTCAVFE